MKPQQRIKNQHQDNSGLSGMLADHVLGTKQQIEEMLRQNHTLAKRTSNDPKRLKVGLLRGSRRGCSLAGRVFPLDLTASRYFAKIQESFWSIIGVPESEK